MCCCYKDPMKLTVCPNFFNCSTFFQTSTAKSEGLTNPIMIDSISGQMFQGMVGIASHLRKDEDNMGMKFNQFLILIFVFNLFSLISSTIGKNKIALLPFQLWYLINIVNYCKISVINMDLDRKWDQWAAFKFKSRLLHSFSHKCCSFPHSYRLNKTDDF